MRNIYLIVLIFFTCTLYTQNHTPFVFSEPIYTKSCLRHIDDSAALQKCNTQKFMDALSSRITYPIDLRGKKQDIWVICDITIKTDGSISPKLVAYSHPQAGKELLKKIPSVKPWFKCAYMWDTPVEYTIRLNYHFGKSYIEAATTSSIASPLYK